MEILIFIIIVILGLCSFLLTYLIKRIAFKKNILDVPNERSLHVAPTPRGGGVAIVITWYIGITILLFSGMIDRNLYFALLSGIMLTIISFIDDIFDLKPMIRLVIHFFTAVVAFTFLGGLRPFIIPGVEMNFFFLIYPVVIIGMVWFINLFNFMDGVDGFASLEAIIISLVLFILSGSIINILFIACILGFLYWNWPKAKIFMGDVGSTQLGFILIVLGIHFHNTLQFSVLNWIMLSSPFWFDATFTLYRRWQNGEELSKAHRKHAYQRIVQSGFSHRKVNVYLLFINALVVLMIFIYREIKLLQIPLFLLSLTFFYFITKQIDKRIPFK